MLVRTSHQVAWPRPEGFLSPYVKPLLRHTLGMSLVGLMGALSMAPLHLWYLGVFSVLILMVVGWFSVSTHQAQGCGWWWGYGFYMGILYWIGHGLWVDAARFAWIWPFVFLIAPALLALYVGLMMGILFRIRCAVAMNHLEYSLGFALMWSLMEWTQGHLFTGFPWTLLAYMWGNLPISQLLAYMGTYGLSLLTVGGVAVMGGIMIHAHQRSRSLLWAIVRAGSLGLCMFSLCLILGRMRLSKNPTQYHEKILLRCVQPAIDQKEKLNPSYAQNHWNRLWELSETPSSSPMLSSSNPTASSSNPSITVIWPEGALPWCMTPETLHVLPEFSVSNVLIGGDYRDQNHNLYNGLLMKRSGKILVPLYAKMHLLPFGEYFPGRLFLEQVFPKGWLSKITAGPQDFTHGSSHNMGKQILNCPGLPPFRCLICYESIFPGTIRSPHQTIEQKRIQPPQWILNVTNDAWFGQSWGPHQHALSARFRAIEEGLPLVRVANTGISCIVDPLGRILQFLPLGQRGVLEGRLPQAIAITLYGQYQDAIWFVMMLCGGGIFLIIRGVRCVRRWGKRT